MDPKLKAEWVAALRSGKYQQTSGILESNGNYCCLGVLCRVAGKPIHTDPDAPLRCDSYHDFIKPLLGDGTYDTFDGITGALIIKNDNDKLTFPQIADWVEQNL